MNPDFRHIRRVYKMELGKSVKFAHKLSDKVLASTPVERVNVQLANAIFHESTINALVVYSAVYPEFLSTAKFLKTIRKWWDIVNVGDIDTGKQKRDPSKNAVTLENFENAEFLSEFADWLDNWQSSSKGSQNGLTVDTFFTAIHTSRTLPLLADYLLRVKKFKYVLFRKCQNDCLEGRFGHHRQLNGGNYYAGVRQFLEAEKTIRLKSLIKFSNLNMTEIKEVFKPNTESEEAQIKVDAATLLENFDFWFSLRGASVEDKAILHYVSGYIAKSILKSESCESCRKLIVKDETTLEVSSNQIQHDENIDEYKKRFFDVINRGGLCNPSDAIFISTVHAQDFFDQIFKNEDVKSVFMKFKKSREVFVKAFTELITSCPDTAPLSNIKCKKGHHFTKMLIIVGRKIFNIGAKNYVNETNSKIHEARNKKRKSSPEDAKTDRTITKVVKLQSGKV